jgi:hypothetical protein
MVGTTSTCERPPLATHRKKASEASDDTGDTGEGDIITIVVPNSNRESFWKTKTSAILTKATGTYTGDGMAIIFIAIPAFRSPNGRGGR